MYDGAPEERRQIRAEWLDAGPSFTVLLTHYDMVIRDKAFLRKVPLADRCIFPCKHCCNLAGVAAWHALQRMAREAAPWHTGCCQVLTATMVASHLNFGMLLMPACGAP